MTSGEALSLAGRVALVTGASRGLGRALALAFGAAGATVACAARSGDQVEDTAARVREAGGQARAFPLDVTRGEQIVTAVAAVTQALGPIDILVNNAGTIIEKKTVEMTDEDWDGILSTNLTSMFRCCRAVAPSMIERRRGKIVNIGSMWGRLGVSRHTAYCVSKAGVDALTRCLAVEWARHGIRVNSLAPGYIRTDFSTAEMADERMRTRILSKIPMRRLGEPDEVGQLAVYLASPAAEFMTGQTIYLD
ncbi:MAG: SDR family oxidoreductase, partial [Candidatus Rokubacteria bacterium]|nr:SDR family oxidoreductase [Candidatus Rokubacteria bacterium]